jgi:hypothetical protein
METKFCGNAFKILKIYIRDNLNLFIWVFLFGQQVCSGNDQSCRPINPFFEKIPVTTLTKKYHI